VEANQSSPARAAGRLNVSACLIYISLMDIHIYISGCGGWRTGMGLGVEQLERPAYLSFQKCGRADSVHSIDLPLSLPYSPPSLSLSLFDTRQDDKYKMRYIDE